ncbi:mucin-2-like isoform X3 [Ruditapes philippinarum]|uniref:mucin-2-like isoform X3 n=1 Tax=Ruditapes philippinarum TaxID=129788 RepID=UPI00295B23CD|nr:mucin-2-like isoform X3 [Ruditapes philippinarum]
MSVILRLGAVNTDSPYSRIVSEESDYDKHVDMSPVAEDPYNSPPQTYPGCFGLPYQDHNYGAPPPPTPPQTPPIVTPTVKESVEVKEEIVVTSDIPTVPTVSPMTPEPLQDEDVDDPTRCICDFVHDDGYMIQCDKCSVWQHIVCMGLDRDSIPDVYFCEVCRPRSVDRVRAREFQIRKREFLKSLVIKSHDSSTDTDPEEVNNRLKAYGLDPPGSKNKQKMKLKKRKERSNSKTGKRLKIKEMKTEKENTSCEMNRRNKLLVKDFSSRTAQVKREKLSKKIEKMRAERLSKEMKEDKFSSDDLREDEKIINTINTIPAPLIQDENAQNPWDMNTFNEWEQSYEVARYNQYTTYVQEYLNSTCINGHHNDIADLVTDGLRVQRCRVKALKNKRKGLESSCSIPNGQPVIEVIGKIMTRQQYDKDNFGQRQLSPFVFFYGTVFDLDLVIDASDYGNDARFIRRSCQPNAAVHHVVAGGQAHFIAVASKEITEGCEITIPFDYDYKKWNYCVECACLRNNCPVSRFQKRRLRFQKLQQQNGSSPSKKFHKHDKIPKLTIKTPVKSPTKSPVKTPVQTPEKVEVSSPTPTPTPETIHVSPQMPSPTKMVRRSQVSRQNSSNASTQASSGRVRSLRVPSQNSDDNSVNESLTVPEPSSMRFSETDHLTSPEAVSDSNKDSVNNSDTPKPEEKRKLTREERKMEAIMKAFEKMEKRNARKASQDHCKVKTPQDPVKVKDPEQPFKEKEKEEQGPKMNPKKKEKVVKKVEPQVVVKEEPKACSELEVSVATPEKVTVPQCKVEASHENMEVDVDTGVKQEPEEVKEEERTRPNLRERPPPPPKTKKAKKTGGRRRVRNTSGAGSLSTETPSESNEENSNSAPPQAASCPVTPAVQLESTTAPPSFLLRKTKRHLMNEWLTEKSFETTKSEPLEVAVEEDNMFVTCLPSPRNSMDRFRRNSASAGVRERSSSLLVETSAGSAKKRWLRQAMGEGSNESSGMSSPVPASGGMSPNPQATMPSPGGSPPIDFVTPLKKRRLARESLSRESNDSPAQTPTPVTQAATSYFASLSETFENFKNKNGFNSLFSPLKSSDIDTEVKSVQKCEVSAMPGCSQVEVSSGEDVHNEVAGPSHCSNDNMEVIPDNSADKNIVESEIVDGKENVSSCAEMDCSVQCDTGTDVCHGNSVMDNQISNVTSEVEESRTVDSEQMNVCDRRDKSANSEPDSSDSVCQGSESVQEDVECDSGTSGSQTVAVETGSEVDSTETNVRLSEVESMSENTTQCDSCNSERTNSTVLDTSTVPGPSSVSDSKVCASLDRSNLLGQSNVSSNLPGPSSVTSVSDNKACASSSLSLSSPPLVLNNVIDSSSFTNRTILDRLTQVDSSTDQPRIRRNSVSGSLLLESAVTSNSSNILSTDHNILHPTVHNTHESLENEVSNSFAIDNVGSNANRNLVGSVNFTDPFSVTSNSSSDIAPMPNRHLKFLSDSSYSADMTVDSTTQFVSNVGTSNLLNSSVLPGMVGYDSDSMDVTSASETGIGAGYDESRRGSEDSLTGFLEPMSSTSNDSSQLPKEKKKVSLQEYLKRKKEKTCTSGTPVSPSMSSSNSAPVAGPSKVSTVSSTTTTSPLKLANPITLKKLDEKLPPLPSLPSLPMFEKTERKEFKSSSDLLSPIFNREKKQEEVRKPMSLSERLRQEFGLDDSTDDTDAEQTTDQTVKGTTNGNGGDVPPPPPPPPQSSRSSRMTNGGGVQSLLNIKTYPSSSLKAGVESASAAMGGPSSAVPKMVPPPPGGLKNNMGVAVPSMVPPPNSKPHLTSTLQAPLSNLLSNVKNPQKLQNDLTAQLAAIKAQISKVQKSLPNPSSSASLSSSVDQLGTSTSANGISSSGSKPQVFDYGHQSGTNFLRQNSHPSSSSSSKNFQSYKKSSPSASFGKVSPRMKVSPTLLNHSFNNSNSHSQNGPGNQSYNNHRDLSPSSWNQKRATSSNNHSVSRKPFSKQTSHKY